MKGKVERFFEFPFRGPVYAVSGKDLKETEYLAKLPDDTVVLVLQPQGFYPRVREVHNASGKMLSAKVVIADGQFQQRLLSWRNWPRIIRQINAAAASNTLFTVDLTGAEYAKLKRGGLEKLKSQFTELAWQLLKLEEDSWNTNGPALELLRECGCCH